MADSTAVINNCFGRDLGIPCPQPTAHMPSFLVEKVGDTPRVWASWRRQSDIITGEKQLSYLIGSIPLKGSRSSGVHTVISYPDLNSRVIQQGQPEATAGAQKTQISLAKRRTAFGHRFCIPPILGGWILARLFEARGAVGTISSLNANYRNQGRATAVLGSPSGSD